MKVCLITAPAATEFADLSEIDSCLNEPAVSGPQLGVLSLAAALEAQAHDVRIFDVDRAYVNYLGAGYAPNTFMTRLGELITAPAADVYGLSTLCGSYPVSIRIAQAIKSCQPGLPILFGGPQASVVDRLTLEAFPFVDFVLRGEAEVTLPHFLRKLAADSSLDDVPGLTYRSKQELRRNASAPVIEDLDAIPMPAYHLLGSLQNPGTLSVELGRGCPYACTFCSTNDFFRRRFRLRSPARVIEDMRALASIYGAHEFELVHDMFTIDRRRVAAFCEAMIASQTDFKWSCSARTDSVDEQLLDLMFTAGCTGIFYGVETGSPRMQKIIDKHLDVDRVRKVITTTERLGISCTVSLITGFPEETWDDVERTLRISTYSTRHPHATPQLNILAPLAETPIHTEYRGELTLGELCSEMSQQGTAQDPENVRLIQSYPDIFPNFYLLPTPHLDRPTLLELREFMLNVNGHFRWLVCAIDQATDRFLDFFNAWRERRLKSQPGLNGLELRSFYRTAAFREAFVSFVHSEAVAQDKCVAALLEFEDAWQYVCSVSLPPPTRCQLLPPRHKISGDDIPMRSGNTKLLHLSRDIQAVIEGLKSGTEPIWRNGPHFYLASDTTGGLKHFRGLHPQFGMLLQMADGTTTILELIQKVVPLLGDVTEHLRREVLMGLIESAREHGLLDLYRPRIHIYASDSQIARTSHKLPSPEY